MSTTALLRVEGLTVDLPPGADRPHAIEDVSFEVNRGEILCLVGESGSGKSMTAGAIMGLLPVPHVRASAGAILLRARTCCGCPRSACAGSAAAGWG